VSTPIVVSSSLTSPDRSPTPGATDNTSRRSLAEPAAPPSSSQPRSRRATQQRQSWSSSQDPPDHESIQSEEATRERQERSTYLYRTQKEDREAIERESGRQYQEQAAQNKLRYNKNGSTKRSNYQGYRLKDTVPPPKHRQTLLLSFTGRDSRDQSHNNNNQSYWPLFGYPGDITTISAINRRQAILNHLSSQVGFSEDKNLFRAKTKL
jgi:hypothetical protein